MSFYKPTNNQQLNNFTNQLLKKIFLCFFLKNIYKKMHFRTNLFFETIFLDVTSLILYFFWGISYLLKNVKNVILHIHINCFINHYSTNF